MKKTIKIFLVLAILLLIGIATAITLNNRNITLSRERETKAIELGINVYDTEDYQKGDLYQRCLISLSDYNLPCSNFMNESLLDDWEEERINEILEVAISRSNQLTKTKDKEGQTIISS